MKLYRIKCKARFFVFLLVILTLIASTIFMQVEASNKSEDKFVVVKKGETLWGISEDNYDYRKEDIREYIFNIKKLNNLDDANLYIGQIIKLPYW